MKFNIQTQESWDQYVTRVNSMSQSERMTEITYLALVWEEDWGVIQARLMHSKKPPNVIENERREYLGGCRQKLMEAFGYAGMLT